MRKLTYLGILGFALFPLNTFAQNEILPVKIGEKINGALTNSSPTLELDNSPYQLYSIKAQKGNRLKITMNSNDFTPIFMAGDIISNKICSKCIISDAIDNNIAIGLLDINEDIEIKFRATTSKANKIGNFDFIIESFELPDFKATKLNIGDKINGTLQYEDELGDDDDLMDNYSINLKQGDFIEVNFNSDAFDPRLVIIGDNGFYKIDYNGGLGNNSKIKFHAPIDGNYYIHALSELSQIGKYELSVQKIDNLNEIKSIPVLFGRKNSYSLNNDDIETNEGDIFYAKRFKLNAKKGKKYWIDAQSNEIDLKLEIGTQTKDGDFYIIQEDDNSGENNNPLIFFTAQESGEYFLRIGASTNSQSIQKYKSGVQKIGNFNLSIKEAIDIPLPKAGRPIQLGQIVKDKLVISGPRDFENKLVKFFTLPLKAGQNTQISLSKDENAKKPIDPHLEIGIGTPKEYEILNSDDDSGGNKNALLKFNAIKTQDYLIIARAKSPVSNGDFTLSTKLILSKENEIRPIK